MGEMYKYVPAKIRKISDELQLEIFDMPVRVQRKLSLKTMTELQKLNQEGKAVHSLGTKTYITECFFQPKAVPIRYAETVIVKIGSQKKTYYESVYYEMKPIPTHWRETMIANLNFQNCKTEAKISREEIHHYISLPQETNSERFI